MTLAPHGVHHLAVVVADLARAEAFYAGVLGLRVVRRHDDAAGQPRAVWLALAAGDVPFLALERAGAGGPTRDDRAPGWHCVALAIAPGEREAWRARLAAAGHPVERASAYTIYARDPDGALVALSHYPTPAP
jgi:hypothetical protein